MNFSYCPHMDRLGGELIEAYRLLDDQDDFWPARSESPDQITAIHHRMAEHRKVCPLCRRIASYGANNRPGTAAAKVDVLHPH